MPRIEAPTLAEHRDRRRASLLAAGRELAMSLGGRGVTMSAVAARAGLSRTAVYEYFPSTDALLASLAVEELRRWTDDITAALAGAPTPEEKVRAYVRASLTYVAEGNHRLAAAILQVPMPPECAAALGHMRDELATPLAAALDDLGVRDAYRAAAQVHGVVEASTRRIEAGAAAGPEIGAAEDFAMGGVRALA